MSPTAIILNGGSNGFNDEKDYARTLRRETILPALERNDPVVLDFSQMKSSTQSFVHALLGEALKRYGESALDKIEFRNCNPLMKSLVGLVVDYSLGGFASDVKPNKKRAAVVKATPKRAGNGKSRK